jgi:transcriptional regulatory protein LevR
MVEVFRTNIVERDKANWLIAQIEQSFLQYKATFDLEDCDRILVVKCATGVVEATHLIEFLKNLDCDAEVLPDE